MKKTFNEEEVKEMIVQAFIKGEDYGVTYIGWYVPTKEEKSNVASKDCQEIFEKYSTKK